MDIGAQDQPPVKAQRIARQPDHAGAHAAFLIKDARSRRIDLWSTRARLNIG
jgi:hypothetical protein